MWVLQRGHSGDGCDLASTLCKYDLRKGPGRFVCSELGKGATSETGKSLFRAVYVWWRCALYFVITSLSVYSLFSYMVGLPPHNAPFPEVLKKCIGAAFFYDRMPFLTSTTCVECSVK